MKIHCTHEGELKVGVTDPARYCTVCCNFFIPARCLPDRQRTGTCGVQGDEIGASGAKAVAEAVDAETEAGNAKVDAETVALVRRLRETGLEMLCEVHNRACNEVWNNTHKADVAPSMCDGCRTDYAAVSAADAWLAAREKPVIVSNGQYVPFQIGGKVGQIFTLPNGFPLIIPNGGYIYVTDGEARDPKDTCVATQYDQENQRRTAWWVHLPPAERWEECPGEHVCTPDGTRCAWWEKTHGRDAYTMDRYCSQCGGKLMEE